MEQQLVLETTKQKFDEAVERLVDGDYRVITGSMYVKSIISSVTDDISGISEQQVNPFFSITLETWSGRNKMINEQSPDEFKKAVNEKLAETDDEGFDVIVGSTYISNEKTNGFPRKFKCMQTFYTCVMESS